MLKALLVCDLVYRPIVILTNCCEGELDICYDMKKNREKETFFGSTDDMGS